MCHQWPKQFESGELTYDTVCGVKGPGEKICLYPLNCKYHAVSIRRLVDGRTLSHATVCAPRPVSSTQNSRLAWWSSLVSSTSSVYVSPTYSCERKA